MLPVGMHGGVAGVTARADVYAMMMGSHADAPDKTA